MSEKLPAHERNGRNLFQKLTLVGLISSSGVFLFCVYVAFTLCAYCLTNPNHPSPRRLPWETHPSSYWNIDGVYATIAFAGILTFFFLYNFSQTHPKRLLWRTFAKSVFRTAYLGSAIVAIYTTSVIFFDPINFNNHVTNYEPNFEVIKWITNKDLLIISSLCLLSLTVCVSLTKAKKTQENRHGSPKKLINDKRNLL